MTTAAASVSTSVPISIDGADWSQVEPIFNELLARPIATRAALEQWLIDRGEAEAACDEARANLYIASSCDTENKAKEAAFAAFVENVAPRLETIGFELDKRQVAIGEKLGLDAARYGVLQRNKKARVELFRAENVAIQTELDKMSQEYGKVSGSQMVKFDGAERTLPQMVGYQLSTDRAIREAAWRAVADRRLQDRAALDDLLDRMVSRRHAMAKNAGCASFVEYTFRDKFRFDYTPADCEKFWNAVSRHVTPLVRRLDDHRRKALGLSALKPWDLAVDTRGRDGLRPFDGGRELYDKTGAVFDGLDARLAALYKRMGVGIKSAPAAGADGDRTLVSEYLDLDSRKGKRPGGYQYNRARTRRPFIFMNAAGLHRDAMTMIHEAGHAFHSMLCAGEPLLDYRSSPIEFAEVASMSMEHLTMPHWGRLGAYYTNTQDLKRAQAEHLEDSISILSWIASIDAFQHWMYANPTHTHQQRDDFWLSLDDRFGRGVEWNGWERAAEHRRAVWQRQGHLFSHPLYYIEYGIAQLGALQLWLKGKREGEKAAVDAYINALSLGGSKPLPELFAAAGMSFDFGDSTVARVVEATEKELDALSR